MEKRRIFVTKKGWLWNSGGDVRMGGMGSFSLNCQVWYVMVLLFLDPFFPSFVRLSLLISFCPRICSLGIVSVSHSFFYSISTSLLLGISWMNPTLSLLCPTAKASPIHSSHSGYTPTHNFSAKQEGLELFKKILEKNLEWSGRV